MIVLRIAGGALVVLASRYAPLLIGRFPAFVASRLGMEPELAAELMEAARRRLGPGRFAVRASAFALATRGPLDRAVPSRLRRLAIVGFVRPLLADPPQRLAYLLARGPVIPCGGLLPAR